MRAYLQSSIDKVERIETLRESLGCPPFRFDDLTRRAADAARVAIGTTDMLDWTRSLTHAQADALIEALEDVVEDRQPDAAFDELPDGIA